MSVNLRSLIGKLNPATRGCVEAGAGLCLARTHYDVEIEHFLTKALDSTDGDLAQILKHFGVNRSRLADDLARGLDRLKSGNARTPSLSPTLVKMLTEAWTLGSIDLGAPQVRIGHCVLALVATSELARLASDISKEFEKIPAEVLRKEFATITAPSPEAAAEVGMASAGSAGAPAAGGAPGAAKGGGKTPNLDQFTVDMTQRARDGKIDPVLGPRLRGAAAGRHPAAPAAEQPDPRRRGGRREDGGRRGLRAAHRRGRRARAAAQRDAALARPGAAPGRRRGSRASSRTG
jgi:type VI secretion system protein VasG